MRDLMLAVSCLWGSSDCVWSDETPELPPHVYPFDDELRLHHVQSAGPTTVIILAGSVVHPSHAYSHALLDIQLETQNVRTFGSTCIALMIPLRSSI